VTNDQLFVLLLIIAGLCLLGAAYHIIMFFVKDLPAWRKLEREGRRRGWLK